MGSINNNLTATIFNIQKYCVNDGPGIRTVVFFKGCPLRCKWCSNPESQSVKPQVLHNRLQCVCCLSCKKACPKECISVADGHISINHQECNGCGRCADVCSNEALQIKGKKMTVRQVLDVILQDKPFYEEDGGGATLSGGEFLSQCEFATELLKACHENGINTCCESSAFCRHEDFLRITEHLDLMIFDVKHYNSEKHLEKTGIPTALAHQNIRWALKNDFNVLLRIPIIPNFNNSLDDARNFIPYLKELGAKKVQLLPFHQFGENKYKLLNTPYEYENYANMHPEDLKEYLQILKNGGIEAYL